MRVLVVHCHPSPDSFSRAIRDLVERTLVESGHETRILDLYADGFDPVMGLAEWQDYHIGGKNEIPVAAHLALVHWAEMLVFVYPTWWFGLPALLKGWLDRVFVPHATFIMPTASRPMGPALTNIRRIAVVTTCGASWLESKIVGEPGRRTILRGVRAVCHPWCRRSFLAHYKMDSSTPATRERFLRRVERRFRLIT